MDVSFRFFKLALAPRLVFAGALYALAALAQVSLSAAAPGFLLVIPAWFFLAIKGASNKPRDKGLEEWRAVSNEEITRIADGIRQSKKLRAKVGGPVALGVLFLVAMAVAGVASAFSNPNLSLAFLDLALFSVPGLFFGRITVHLPVDMDRKLPCFLAIMDAPRPAGWVLTPYLRFDKDEEDRDVPEDMRFMLEPRRKPADLVGVQFQASINNGEHGPVPYLYAVVLARGRTGPAYGLLRTMQARGYTVEAGGDDAYGTVVVRQDTGGGGYHTTPDDCEALFGLMVKALEKAGA